jgi:hypothetical protein
VSLNVCPPTTAYHRSATGVARPGLPEGQGVLSITRAVDGAAALLTDNEVPHLWVLSIFPDTGDTRLTVDGYFVFQHLDVKVTKFSLVPQKSMQIIRKFNQKPEPRSRIRVEPNYNPPYAYFWGFCWGNFALATRRVFSFVEQSGPPV